MALMNLAQSFRVNRPGGCFATKIDLYFSQKDAKDVSDFMEPLLDFDPKTRWTALAALQSRWLRE